MFDLFNREEKKQVATEQREQNFIKQRDVFNAASEDNTTLIKNDEQRNDLVRWQQDLDEPIDELKHDLLKEVPTKDGWVRETVFQGYGQDGKEVWVEVKPMVNQEGVYRLITVVKRYLNRNLMMSNFGDEAISKTLINLKTDLVINIGSKYREYDIDTSDMSLIVRCIMDSVKATIYRALNNGERSYLNTINKRVEAYTENANSQPKKGILSFGG